MSQPDLTHPGLREMSRGRGLLAKDLYAITTTPTDGLGPVLANVEAHLDFQAGLEARRIAESDPMHQAGARRFTLRPWLLNEGTVTVKINYAAGTREIL